MYIYVYYIVHQIELYTKYRTLSLYPRKKFSPSCIRYIVCCSQHVSYSVILSILRMRNTVSIFPHSGTLASAVVRICLHL